MRSGAYIEILFHWQRYLSAREACRGKRVLDLASGDGYGSHCLAAVAADVLGVDVDGAAVAEARKKYVRDNLRYVQGSAERIPAADGSVEVVVSFETFEHLSEAAQRRFLDEIDRVLAPDGLLLISSPDRQRTESAGMRNPYHLHEVSLEELRDTLRRRFAAVELYLQEVNLGTFLWREGAVDAPLHGFRIDHGGAEAVPTDEQMRLHLYLVAVCGKKEGTLPPLASVCSEISRRGVEELWNQVGALGWQRDRAQAQLEELTAKLNLMTEERQQLRRALEMAATVRWGAERATTALEQLRADLEEVRALNQELASRAARPWWLVGLSENRLWRAAKSMVRRTPAARWLAPVKDRAYRYLVRPRHSRSDS